MADRWGTVVGIVNMIKFSNLWGDYVQDFLPRADQPSLQVKLDDAQAAIMLEHDEELLRTLGCTEPVDVTNAVAAANGKMLQLPARAGEDEEPTEPRGRFAPRRCRQPVVLMTAERKCTTCGNDEMSVTRKAASKGRKVSFNVFFSDGPTRRGIEIGLVCDTCSERCPEKGVVQTTHWYQYVRVKRTRDVIARGESEHKEVLVPNAHKLPYWRYPFGGICAFSTWMLNQKMLKSMERARISVESGANVAMSLAPQLGGEYPSHICSIIYDAFFTFAMICDEVRWKFPADERLTAEELLSPKELPRLKLRHVDRAKPRMMHEQIEKHDMGCPYPFEDESMADDGLEKWGFKVCDNLLRRYLYLEGYTPFANQMPQAQREPHAGRIYIGCSGRPAYKSLRCIDCLEEGGYREPSEDAQADEAARVVTDASIGEGAWACDICEDEGENQPAAPAVPAAPELPASPAAPTAPAEPAAPAAHASPAAAGEGSRQLRSRKPFNYREAVLARKQHQKQAEQAEAQATARMTEEWMSSREGGGEGAASSSAGASAAMQPPQAKAKAKQPARSGKTKMPRADTSTIGGYMHGT